MEQEKSLLLVETLEMVVELYLETPVEAGGGGAGAGIGGNGRKRRKC